MMLCNKGPKTHTTHLTELDFCDTAAVSVAAIALVKLNRDPYSWLVANFTSQPTEEVVSFVIWVYWHVVNKLH